MESLANFYKLDKSLSLGFHNYIPIYEKKFSQYKDSIKCLLEIGIGCIEKDEMTHVNNTGYQSGNSLRMWRDYFTKAQIYGIDIHPEAMITNEDRITTYIGDQSDDQSIINIIRKINRDIDIVIDDGSHNPQHQINTFMTFHSFLKPGSIYCIEDIFSHVVQQFKDYTIFPAYFQEIIKNEYVFEFFDQRRYDTDNSVICMFTKKKSSPKKVYVTGIGGLGNCMFQIANAVYYAEKHDFKIILDSNSEVLHFGTAHKTDRDKRKKINDIPISYKDTILKNLTFSSIGYDYPIVPVENNYTCHHILPNDDENLIIKGYCQNHLLFYPILEKLPNYFNLDEPVFKKYIRDKYVLDHKHNIMIGIRACQDFAHMNNISKQSYKKALDNIIKTDFDRYRIIIISDTIQNLHEKIDIPTNIEVIIPDEDDIIQFYIGLECSTFILSESTFHYWIALLKYIKDEPHTEVYCFLDTDITNRNLALPEWHKFPIS